MSKAKFVKADNPQEAKPKAKKSKYKKAFKKLQNEYNELLTVNKKLGSKLKYHKEHIEALSKEIERLKCSANEIQAHISNLKYPKGRYILNNDVFVKNMKEAIDRIKQKSSPSFLDEVIAYGADYSKEPTEFDGSKTMKNHTEVFNKIKDDYNMEKWEASHDTLANTVEVTFFKKL